MTLPTVRSAARIVFLVTGEDKAEAVARAFGGEISRAVPASLVRLAPVPVEVFLDEPAAARRHDDEPLAPHRAARGG